MAKRRGFTLIEVLVVIGIIALLIAILVPVLGAARRAAAKANNASQLRNIPRCFATWAANYPERGGTYPTYPTSLIGMPAWWDRSQPTQVNPWRPTKQALSELCNWPADPLPTSALLNPYSTVGVVNKHPVGTITLRRSEVSYSILAMWSGGWYGSPPPGTDLPGISYGLCPDWRANANSGAPIACDSSATEADGYTTPSLNHGYYCNLPYLGSDWAPAPKFKGHWIGQVAWNDSHVDWHGSSTMTTRDSLGQVHPDVDIFYGVQVLTGPIHQLSPPGVDDYVAPGGGQVGLTDTPYVQP